MPYSLFTHNYNISYFHKKNILSYHTHYNYNPKNFKTSKTLDSLLLLDHHTHKTHHNPNRIHHHEQQPPKRSTVTHKNAKPQNTPHPEYGSRERANQSIRSVRKISGKTAFRFSCTRDFPPPSPPPLQPRSTGILILLVVGVQNKHKQTARNFHRQIGVNRKPSCVLIQFRLSRSGFAHSRVRDSGFGDPRRLAAAELRYDRLPRLFRVSEFRNIYFVLYDDFHYTYFIVQKNNIKIISNFFLNISLIFSNYIINIQKQFSRN